MEIQMQEGPFVHPVFTDSLKRILLRVEFAAFVILVLIVIAKLSTRLPWNRLRKIAERCTTSACYRTGWRLPWRRHTEYTLPPAQISPWESGLSSDEETKSREYDVTLSLYNGAHWAAPAD